MLGVDQLPPLLDFLIAREASLDPGHDPAADEYSITGVHSLDVLQPGHTGRVGDRVERDAVYLELRAFGSSGDFKDFHFAHLHHPFPAGNALVRNRFGFVPG